MEFKTDVTTMISGPTFSAQVRRKELINKFIAILFNFLMNKCQYNGLFAARFAATIIVCMLKYVLSEKFTKENPMNPGVQGHLEEKMKELERLLNTSSDLGDDALMPRDKQIIHIFSTLFVIEGLLGVNKDQILDKVFPKTIQANPENALDVNHTCTEIDLCLQDIMKSLNLADLVSQPVSSIYSALLVRALITQLLKEYPLNYDVPKLSNSTKQFLHKRRLDFSLYVLSATQVKKCRISRFQVPFLEHDTPIFLGTCLMHPTAGHIFKELITSSDTRIMELPLNAIFAKLEEQYGNSFYEQ